MDNMLEKLRGFKQDKENNGEKIVDISYYGKINLSKNDSNINNQKQEDLYLVKKEIDGKIVSEFHTNLGIIATIGEEGEIVIDNNYMKLINEKELLLQLREVMPLSLKKLEELDKNKEINSEREVDKLEDLPGPKKYIPNAKDIKIDMSKKITETKTFKELVPEVRGKGIVDVVARRKDNTKFELIGINTAGEEINLETLQQTEGTNPTKDVVEINQDGSQVKKEQVMTMLKIKNGENQANQDEGFTINLGDYGTPEVNYYRRSRETNEYTSIPVNLENTNQKRTELEVREFMEKKRNTGVQDNIERAEDRIEANEDKQTNLQNIDDDLSNDKIVDSSEIQIIKAAKRCKISVEAFKQELDKADGNTLEEKIENAEEEINEQFRGNSERRL